MTARTGKAVEGASSGCRAGVEGPAADGMGAIGALQSVGVAGAALPLFVSVQGRELVIVSREEFIRLSRAALRLPIAEARVAALSRGPSRRPSTVERDPEVAAFLRERFALADTIEAAHRACSARFGAKRTPSLGRVGRFRRWG